MELVFLNHSNQSLQWNTHIILLISLIHVPKKTINILPQHIIKTNIVSPTATLIYTYNFKGHARTIRSNIPPTSLTPQIPGYPIIILKTYSNPLLTSPHITPPTCKYPSLPQSRLTIGTIQTLTYLCTCTNHTHHTRLQSCLYKTGNNFKNIHKPCLYYLPITATNWQSSLKAILTIYIHFAIHTLQSLVTCTQEHKFRT